eukprot:TRINITY_DN42994_c0_g1_i1.p1 TRINITY_DN42994_c0_g1~~TRINITY_DN42994_c0_g1_i1.p1  ORF type:complete len:542 (+),score=101.12 TRINITY_DN42994_c0_g1_i1:139-1764(+)
MTQAAMPRSMSPSMRGVEVETEFVPEVESDVRFDTPKARLRRPRSGAADVSGVYVDESEDGGRTLRVSRPARRGEALLVEDVLFLSPACPEELEALLGTMCDPKAVEEAATAAAAAGSATRSAPGAAPSWMSRATQLMLVIIKALVEDNSTDQPRVEAFRGLRGDTERWAEPSKRLWNMLNEEYRSRIALQAVVEVYGIVKASIRAESPEGRAGIYQVGSNTRHSCAPTAYQEVVVPIVEQFSRPGSSACGDGRDGVVPGSPSMSGRLSFGSMSGLELEVPRFLEQLVLRAERDLDENADVTVSMIPEYLPTWQRRVRLQVEQDFVCTCERCVRDPEVVCAFVCPQCNVGPCSPAGPVLAPGDFGGHPLLCEACGAMISEEAAVAPFSEADKSEAIGPLLHPYHHRIVNQNMKCLQELTPPMRIQAIEHLMTAAKRLAKSDVHPLLGKLAELSASAHLDHGDLPAAVNGYRRAEELYALSHRGPPDAGHEARCHEQRTMITAGRLGRVPRRLETVASNSNIRSPSLPRLAETDMEGVVEEQ